MVLIEYFIITALLIFVFGCGYFIGFVAKREHFEEVNGKSNMKQEIKNIVSDFKEDKLTKRKRNYPKEEFDNDFLC